MSSIRNVGSLLLACALAAPASAATVDASSRGWFSNRGVHTAGDQNAYAGQGAGTDRYRAFFVFDLGARTLPASEGVLRLEFESVLGPDAAEVFSVYDVSTPVDDLLATQSTRSDIYDDLGSGVYYGIAAAFKNAPGTVLEIPLEPDAIADINRANGGRFAVGVFVETVRMPLGNEGVRFSLTTEPRVHQLVLTDAPQPPTLTLGPELAFLALPATHAVDATLLSGDGSPLADATIDFSVVSGPNAGAAASVASDANGAARFELAGGAVGVDHIQAAHTDANGTPLAAEARAFWDADCNGNQMPDHCDVSCDGFDGECAAFAGCGGSADADADGSPDECRPSNSPPECSEALVAPGLLRRVDHRYTPVNVGGVSDPDGDPVALRIDAVFQDEPVDGFQLGGGKPDAVVVGDGRINVRAQARERGDGRVYHIAFSADDGKGGTCTGTATVCVPRPGWRRSDDCVDQGPLHDSTVATARHGHRWRWAWGWWGWGWNGRGHH
jgi:hypothetical protein